MTAPAPGIKKLRCPRCRGDSLIQHKASDPKPPREGATCRICGSYLSAAELKVEAAKVSQAFTQALVAHIKKSLK